MEVLSRIGVLLVPVSEITDCTCDDHGALVGAGLASPCVDGFVRLLAQPITRFVAVGPTFQLKRLGSRLLRNDLAQFGGRRLRAAGLLAAR